MTPPVDYYRAMPRRELLRHPVAWLVLWYALLLVVLSVLHPVWRAPDEPAHVDMARWAAGEWGWPHIGDREVSRQVTGTLELVGVADGPERLGAPAPPRPSFGAVAADEPSGTTQQMVQHPPLYYELIGRAGALLLPDEIAFDTEVTVLRLLSALLMLPVLFLAWRTARQLVDDRSAVVAAVLVAGVPQLAHIGASVNNDTLLVLLSSAMAPLLVRIARGEGSMRLVVAAGALGGLACLTKGFGFFTPLWLVVAVVVGRRDVVRRCAASLAALFVAGGWWIVRNVVVEGAVQPSGFGYPDPPPGFEVDIDWWAGFFWGRFNGRFWFEPDAVPRSSPPVAQWLTVAVAVLAVMGAVVLWRRSRVGVAATLALPPVVLFGLTAAGAFNYYRSVGSPWGISGRYVFPAVVAVAVLVAVAVAGRRWAALVAVVVAVVLHGFAMWWAFDRYWDGIEGLRAWSPLPWAAVVAALAGLQVATVGLVAATASTCDDAADGPTRAPRRRDL